MKRLLMIVLLTALCANAFAETTPEAPDSEMLAVFVETMFAAATGTSFESETALRKEMSAEELQERTDACAAYRAMTTPWLMEALRPEEEALPGSMPTPDPTPSPEPTVEPTPDPLAEPVWTIEDSYAAFVQNEFGQAYLGLLEEMGGTDAESCMEITRELCALWMAEVDHGLLEEMNADYACWIYSPGTQIDYPVVQCEDNSYYLKRLFNGERNAAGTLFVDYRNLPDFQDPNTLIYGHHMRNDSMFGTLTDYAYQAYFEAHPYFLVMNETEICLVELFAGYTTSDEDHCYDIAISDAEDMRLFVETAVGKSDFVSTVQVSASDRLVTLSTCAYAFEDARYIAIGRLSPIWRQETAAW